MRFCFQVIWQEGAPVKSVIYNSPEIEVSVSCIFNVSNLYCHTLEVLAYTGLPEYALHDSFEERADTALVYKLNINLKVNEKMYTLHI